MTQQQRKSQANGGVSQHGVAGSLGEQHAESKGRLGVLKKVPSLAKRGASSNDRLVSDDQPVVPLVGGAIKRLRREKGLSLISLAKESGVSVGMLSQIERDVANPSLRVLTQILHALGESMSALFTKSEAALTDPSFVRRRMRHPMLDLGCLQKELLSSGSSHNLQIFILHIPPKGSSGTQPLSYPAEKGGLVLEGVIVLKVGDEEAVLDQGDSFVFDSSIPHSFNNSSDAPAKLLWIIGRVAVDRHL